MTRTQISISRFAAVLVNAGIFLLAVCEIYGSTEPFVQDGGADGIVSIEAEHYALHTPAGTHQWAPTFPSGYSGESALYASPNSGANLNTGYTTSSPRLDYRVNFLKTGTHYIWARGTGANSNNDSFHAGLDGQAVSSCDRISYFATSLSWSKRTMDLDSPATFNVPSAGEHTVSIWMREDGFILDKIVITTNASYMPSGTGPAESPRDLGASPPDTTPPDVVLTSPVLTNFPNYTLTYTVDGVPFSENLLLVEGANTITRTFTDAAGNRTDVNWTITLDSTAPSGSVLINGGDELASDPYVTIGLTVFDRGGSGIDKVCYSVDQGASWTAWGSFSSTRRMILPSGDGIKEVRYQVRDKAANIAVFSDTITLQSFRPEGVNFFDDFNRASLGPDWTAVTGAWKLSSWKLYHSATNPGIIVLNAPFESDDYDAEARFEFTNLIGGNQRGIVARYQDSANFYYGQYHRHNLKFRIVKVQNGVFTTLREVQAPGVPNYSYHTIRFVLEGSHLKLYFDGTPRLEVDDSTFPTGKVGLYSQPYYHGINDFQVTVFNTALPPVPVVDAVTSPANRTEITLTGAKSAGTGVYANGAQIAPVSNETNWSAVLTLAHEGENHFTITARKASGAESEPVSITVVRDTTPPEIQFTRPLPNSYVNQRQTFVYGTIDGGEFSMIAELEEGSNIVTKTAVDAAGNESTAALPLILDTVPPSVEVISPAGNSWVTRPEVTVRYNCQDDAGVCSSHEISLELENEGVNEITVAHTDPAGNVGIAKHILRLDSIAPEIVFTSHGEGQKVRSTQEMVAYTIDGAPASTLFPLASEGSNTLQIVAEDLAGNFTIATLTLIRDTTPPVFTVTFPEQGRYINRSEVVMP